MLMLSGPTNVVGDIRGSLPDLLRILQERGSPGCENKYVFLGNLVDADSLSLEVLSLMLLLKALFPTDVFVIRGNHEVGSACSKLGFQKELSAAMHDLSIAVDILNMFSNIPFAALVNGTTLCLHSGIGPSLTSINEFRNVQRPLAEFDAPFLQEIVTFEPSEAVFDFNVGKQVFGCKVLEKFLNTCFVIRLVRGHEPVEDGVHAQWNDKCVTVFSASNRVECNKSGVVFLDDMGDMHPIVFEPLARVNWTTAQYFVPDLPAYGSLLPQLKRPAMLVRNIGAVQNWTVHTLENQRSGIRLARNRSQFQSLVLRSKPLGNGVLTKNTRLRKGSISKSLTIIPNAGQPLPSIQALSPWSSAT